jgi:hypothetical protein
MLMLARMVRLAATLIAGVIVVGIVLHVLGANASNAIVSAVYDVAGIFVDPFRNLFEISDAKWEIAVNWGIAAAVYLAVGTLLARLLAGTRTYSGARPRRPWGRIRPSSRST